MNGGWIYSLVKPLYSVKNTQFSQCDLVVPLGYGLLSQNKLPDASEKTLREAVRITSKYGTQIAWTSADYFWPECQQEEDQIKIKKAEITGLTTAPIIARRGATNSVTEAEGIYRAVIEAGVELRSKTIVVVADWPHTRSARKIWKLIFPESNIIMISIDGKWDKSHPAFFCRSELRWLIINIIRHIALILFGMKAVSFVRHPISRKDV